MNSSAIRADRRHAGDIKLVGRDLEGGEVAKASSSLSRVRSTALPQLPAWARVRFDLRTYGNSRPCGLSVHGHKFWKEHRYLGELLHRSGTFFTFGAQQAAALGIPQVVVMVGESSRYDRWSLNGYRRDTNSLLKKEANLVSLLNVVTAVSAARLSVPVLVSSKPACMSL